jgi:hypothetical protein
MCHTDTISGVQSCVGGLVIISIKCYTVSMITIKKERENKSMNKYDVICNDKEVVVLDELNITLSDISLPFDRKIKQVSNNKIIYNVIANNCLEALDIAKNIFVTQFNKQPSSVSVRENIVQSVMTNQLKQVA